MALAKCPKVVGGRYAPFSSHASHSPIRRSRRLLLSHAATNGTHHATTRPTPAETAKTLVDIVNEGTLSTVSADGTPLGTPVAYTLDSEGQPIIQLSASAATTHLAGNARCSLLVQATSYPARALASVAILGQAARVEANGNGPQYQLSVDKCLYFGGLDQASEAQEVSGEAFRAAQPDVLRAAAVDLVASWNEERAEDIYRIVASFLGLELSEMAYAELLWVDHLGMYITAEVSGGQSQVVRVPFYRPVLDERDARSVITMAAQLAWEKERNYVPPSPAELAAANGSSN